MTEPKDRRSPVGPGGLVEIRGPIKPLCGWCGKPATGSATIGDVRYCHPDDGPSCYEAASRSTTPLEVLGSPAALRDRRLAAIRDSVGNAEWLDKRIVFESHEVRFLLDHIDALTAERDALRELIHSILSDSDFAFGGPRIPADVIRADIARDLWTRMMSVIDPGEPDNSPSPVEGGE